MSVRESPAEVYQALEAASWEALLAGNSSFGEGCHYLYHSLASGQFTKRVDSPTHQQKTGLKIYWAWPCPPEQYPVFFTARPSHQEACTHLLFSSIRGKTEWKPQSQKNNQNDHMDHSFTTQWNYELCYERPPKTNGLWGRILTKRGPLEREMANHQHSCLENPMNSMKRQKDRTLKTEPLSQ